MQDRDRGEDRRAREVGEQHRVPRAEPLNERPAGDAEDRHRRDLGGEDERHLPGRARRDEHEPREREVRHPRAEHRDDLGADERSDRGLPTWLTREQYKTSVRFCKVRASMPKISEERRAERREQILAAARRCFAEHGYEGATVVRLEEAIGLSRGAIFNYFPSKEDLFVELAVARQRPHVGDLGERGARCGRRARSSSSTPPGSRVYLELARRVRTDPEFRRTIEAAAGGGHPGEPRSDRGSAALRRVPGRSRRQGDRRVRQPRAQRARVPARRRRGGSQHRPRAHAAPRRYRGASSARYAVAYTRLTRSTSST